MSLSSLPALPVRFGHYELRTLLGRGGMGEVYRAFDHQHGREVAIKVLPGDLAGEPEYRRRFGREAELAARLNDPHVIPIHRFGELGGRLFLDMRLVEGTDLAALIDAEPLDPAEAVLIVEQVAGALDAAHASGLVHRDVKPSNVLVARGPGRPFAYLCDFGIARPVRSASPTLTPSGFLVGTLAYMGPERFGPAEPDPRTDVYALACLLFAALVGDVPFPYDEPAAVIAAHLNERPPRPSLARVGVPAGMDAVVARGMAKRPADRYASAGELARAAQAALDTPVGRGPVTDPARRRRLVDPGAAMLALAAGGATWVVLPNGPTAVPLGLGVAAAVFGTKITAEAVVAARARRRSAGSAAGRTTRIDGGA